MADEQTHPTWLAVGSTARTVRTFGWNSDHVVHDARVVVTRHTKTSVFTRYANVDGTPTAGAERRYKRHPDGRYVLTPRYLDYAETLRPLGGAR